MILRRRRLERITPTHRLAVAHAAVGVVMMEVPLMVAGVIVSVLRLEEEEEVEADSVRPVAVVPPRHRSR